MNHQDKFTELKTSNEGTPIAHICTGDPTPDDTKTIVHALACGGADAIANSGAHTDKNLFPALQIHPEPCQAVFRSSNI